MRMMRKNPKSFLLIMAAGLTVMMFTGAAAQRALQAKPTAIALVDIPKVYNTLAERKQVDADRGAAITRIQAAHDKSVEEIKQLQKDMELYKRDSKAFKEKQAELEQRVILIQAVAEFQKRKLAAEKAIQYKRLYDKIIDAVGKYSQANGYDLTLFNDTGISPRAKNSNVEQIDAMIALRKVLWYRQGLDITEEIVNQMNNAFTNDME
jgi:Skp family chaperone for outer membrane proteins